MGIGLIAYVRSQKCQCLDKEHWPWKRDEKCKRCELIAAVDARKVKPTWHENCPDCTCPYPEDRK